MHPNKKRFLLFLLIIINFTSFSKSNIWFKQELSTESFNIMVTQDKDGFLLFATTDGIIKYDGYNKHIISAGENSISSNLVPSIFVDSEGLIWIATWNGLNLYNKTDKSFTSFSAIENDESTISSSKFNWAPKLIAEDSDGEIWIGTQYGLNKYNKKSKKFIRYGKNLPAISDDNIWCLIADKNNNIWVGTQEGGLLKYNKKNDSFTLYKHNPLRPNESIGKGTVYSILEDNNGFIWVGTSEGGLTRLNPNTLQYKNYRHNPNNPNSLASNEVFSLMEDRQNNIWIGRNYSSSFGIEKFTPHLEKFEVYSENKASGLSGNNYMTSFQDSSGTIWFPNNLGEVDKFDPKAPQFKQFYQLKTVLSTYEDKYNNLWFATATEGLIKYSDGEYTFYQPNSNEQNSIPRSYIFSAIEDADGLFWITTDDGKLCIFNRETEKIDKIFENSIIKTAARDLTQDKFDKNIFWFGSEGDGFFKFNKESGEFKQYKNNPKDENSISNNIIQNLYQDENGILWIPTHGGGLNRFNRETETFTAFKKNNLNQNSISGNMIFDCFIDSKNRFWITTDDGGLNQFIVKKNKFIKYGVNNGFHTEALRSIIEDEFGYLWITSNSGLYKFDPSTEKVLNIYSEKDGLVGSQFNFFVTTTKKLKDNSIIVTTTKGVNRFHPKNILKNNYQPPLVLTSLTHNGEDLVPDKAPEVIKEITLHWPESSFTFEYAALNYTLPEKSKYKYFLEGFDTKWYDAGYRRFGRYSKLPGGHYTLRIKGTNNDGIWSDQEAVLKVTIIPAFWQTTVFKFLIVLLVILLGFLISYLRIKSVKDRNIELENLVEIRTHELIKKKDELNEKNVKLVDSIQYAKRIQEVILPTEEQFRNSFEDVMLFYKAKDIVSGDFFWLNEWNDNIFVVVADCTGHGVPGALLATIGNMLLNKYIVEKRLIDLAEILEAIDRDIKDILSNSTTKSFEGMDLSICKINKKEDSLIFTGARNHLLYVSNENELLRIKGTRRSIGSKKKKKTPDFEVTELKLSSIKTLYMFSDGFEDQLNEDNISITYKQLFKLLDYIKLKPFASQNRQLEEFFYSHKGKQIQTDDVSLLGIKFK